MAVPWQTTDPDAPNYVSNNDYAYVADDEKKLDNLSKYAKELGLYKRIMDLMEVMLNG